MKYAAFLAVFLLCCNSIIVGEPDHAVVGVTIVVMQPEGTGNLGVIPFRFAFKDSGLRQWEIISEPYLAKGEDGTEQDVNLFSLCKIKITAIRPPQNPARISIDFTNFAVPDWIKISKKEIVSSLFACINSTTVSLFQFQPVVSTITTAENKTVVDRAKAEYLQSKPAEYGSHLGERVGTVWLRVRNATGSNLKSVKVSERYSYGDLNNDAVSEYQKVEGEYPYARAEALYGKVKLDSPPVCLTGASPLDPGYYTLTLRVLDKTHLDIKCDTDPEPETK